MTDKRQPEALRLALSIDVMDTFTDYQQEELNKAAAELRRQHARIAELEAEIAGGVQALSAAPAGWKLVPEDATEEMVRATDKVNFANADTDGTMHNVWNVMIAASPTPPAEQQAAPKAAQVEPDKLMRDCLALLEIFDYEDDEDSQSKAFFNAHINADWFFHVKHSIERQLEAKAAPQQEAQEPATVPRFNCWSTNEGDSWFDHPADAQAIYDCLGNDAKVGDEYELTAGWKSVTARYRITEVVGDGEEYEVECISHPQGNTAPQPAPAPLSDDAKRLAWMADGWTPGHEKLYAKHVLETGGAGDLDDLRTFIDKQIAAQGGK